MAFKLPQHIHDKIEAARRAESDARAAFAKLSNEELAQTARAWMDNCQAPKAIEPGEPVYDSTFWHAIAPEMISRLTHQGRPLVLGFTSWPDGAWGHRSFELIVQDRKTFKEVVLKGQLEPSQFEIVDEILPTCVMVGAESNEGHHQ